MEGINGRVVAAIVAAATHTDSKMLEIVFVMFKLSQWHIRKKVGVRGEKILRAAVTQISMLPLPEQNKQAKLTGFWSKPF